MTKNVFTSALRISLSGGLLAFLLVGSSSLAQEAQEEEIYELSPFSITSQEDTGYAATNTLAGTRLRSELKDLAGAVQVVTEEFLKDTGSTNVEDLFLYTTNTEVSGPDGYFGNGGADRRDFNGSTRVRGLAEPDRTRNFFLSDIGLDTYNTDRVTIAKGPNAILFGLGSPAGLYNSNLKQSFMEDATEISLRYGSWGAHREVLDVNRVFIEDVLSFRLIGLNNQNKFRQKPSYEDEQRLYGAMLFKPFEKTTIRANLEVGSRNASRPYIITPSSNIPDWVENGMPTNSDPAASNGWSIFPENRGPLYVFDSPSATTTSVGFDAGPATPGPDGIRRLHFTWANREDAPGANVSNAVLSDEDRWVFDFRNNTLTGTENTSRNSFDAANITLEQQFSQNSGIEIAYDKQKTRYGWLDRASNEVNVDTSEYHGYFFETEEDGTPILVPNEYVGRPYRGGWDGFSNGSSEREAFRVTAFYDLDLRDSDWGWLGRHVFTGLYNDQSREIYTENDSYGIVAAGEIERVLEANRPGNDYTTASYDRGARNVRYLGPRITGIPSSGTVATRTTADTPRIREITAVMYDSSAEDVYPGYNGAYRQITAPLVLDPVNAASIDRQEIESIAITAQSYLLNDHIVGTYGWRQDKAKSWGDNNPELTADAIVLPETLMFPSAPDSSVKDDVFTWGVVGHLPENWRPFGIGLSAHYGESENFVPSPGRITVLNEPLPSPAGETTEYGFSIELPEQNFYVRFNWFETVSKNQTDGSMGNGSIPNYERLWYGGVRSALQEKEPRDPSVPASEYETWDPKDP
ncbi:MAG: TonB-dependent receptor plug domain-containing protein, partial [Verrucomicrobiae bacterium]|nr:TonB-dependent receptor plug domain-containing protein [Verrucomicrobiae bacterium]